MLALQDRHGLSVNMLLWCLWCGVHFETPGDLVIKKAVETSSAWSGAVTAPLRAARRHLHAPSLQAPREELIALKTRILNDELAAEKIEQDALGRLAAENLVGATRAEGGATRARKALAAYIRLTGAAKTPGFSVSLIENLIGLRFPSSNSGGDCVE